MQAGKKAGNGITADYIVSAYGKDNMTTPAAIRKLAASNHRQHLLGEAREIYIERLIPTCRCHTLDDYRMLRDRLNRFLSYPEDVLREVMRSEP
jgi:hypothetical protein